MLNIFDQIKIIVFIKIIEICLMEMDDAGDNVDYHGEDDGYDADLHNGVDVN